MSSSQRNYKELYLDMREINKDLKSHFNGLEEKVNAYVREY
jgi:hypothetical protein